MYSSVTSRSVDESDIDFPYDQPWCLISRTSFRFVDETKEIVDTYEDGSESVHDQILLAASRDTRSPSSRMIPPPPYRAVPGPPPSDHNELVTTGGGREVDGPSDPAISGERSTLHDSGLWHQPLRENFPLPDDQTSQNNRLWQCATLQSAPTSAPTTGNTVSHISPAAPFDVPGLPLQDLREAELMMHYVQHLSSSFDLCDSNRHFKLVVPERAALCPALLYSIMAASARHLSRTAGLDATVAVHYRQMTLHHLIPALDNATTAGDENLLAATVILTFLDEIEGTSSPHDA